MCCATTRMAATPTSSKGHDAPGLYSVLLALGKLPFELVHELRQLGGLPGHPDVGTQGIVANTGSLGMGISKAKGMVLGDRQLGRSGRVFVLTGDGELQEGQIWESLISAANFGLHEIVAIVDHNKLQSDTFVERTSSLGDLVAKFQAFGWHVQRVDGHDVAALSSAIERTAGVTGKPHVIIADTIKGRGVSFMEHTSLDSDVAYYRFHSGAPDAANYTRAAEELIGSLNRQCDALGVPRLAFETAVAPARAQAAAPQRLIPAYARALVAEMERSPKLMVLDADLAVDIGVQPAREAFPARFIECGIAEMDMVSMASGLAQRGLLPLCHSFACFLGTRANEHVYNNATEHAHVVYVASLAGLLPGGPGHSHQSVRDLSAVGGVPGLVALSPSSEREVELALGWAVHEHKTAAYLRLESVPCAVPYALPEGYRLELGVGCELRAGRDAVLIGYGPVLLSEAYHAAERLAEAGLAVAVINLPWLNLVDTSWLVSALSGVPHVFCLDNHFPIGGQGDRIASALAGAGFREAPRLHRLAVETIPACGSNPDVLRAHGLDRQSIFERVLRAVRG